jgi:hypothetical protein
MAAILEMAAILKISKVYCTPLSHPTYPQKVSCRLVKAFSYNRADKMRNNNNNNNKKKNKNKNKKPNKNNKSSKLRFGRLNNNNDNDKEDLNNKKQ